MAQTPHWGVCDPAKREFVSRGGSPGRAHGEVMLPLKKYGTSLVSLRDIADSTKRSLRQPAVSVIKY